MAGFRILIPPFKLSVHRRRLEKESIPPPLACQDKNDRKGKETAEPHFYSNPGTGLFSESLMNTGEKPDALAWQYEK
jgi:hypothetical protein